MEDVTTAKTTPTESALESGAVTAAKALLQSGHESKIVRDTHYKGGVAAAAFEEFMTMDAEDFKMASKKVAMKKVSAPQGRKVNVDKVPKIKGSKSASINMVIEALDKKSTGKKLRNSGNSEQKFKEVSAYLLFILTTGISIAYYVTFKTYHTALGKMESLKKLLNNPNARVAAGDKGKSILNRLSADKKKAEVPKKIVKATRSNETVDLLK